MYFVPNNDKQAMMDARTWVNPKERSWIGLDGSLSLVAVVVGVWLQEGRRWGWMGLNG